MSNSARIIVKVGSVYKSISTHWDGEPTEAGYILNTYYKSPDKVKRLLELGDLSLLGKHIDPPKGYTHTFSNPVPNVTISYRRDRGDEPFSEPDPVYNSLDSLFLSSGENYYYLYKDRKWYCVDKQGEKIIMVDLSKAIEAFRHM